MRAAAVTWARMIPGLQVYLFRRILPDLIKNHVEGPKGLRAMLAPLVSAGSVQIVEQEIRFANGSKIYLCHCKDAADIYKYQGAEIHVLLVDELTHFTAEMYRFLRGRVRMVGITPPPEWHGKFPRILCSSNPGNVGHLWVKQSWIDAAPPGAIVQQPPLEGGMLRQFIPARLEDNPAMAADDPTYEAKLLGLGSEALARAMRWGDWDVVEGAFFDGFDRERHVVSPFKIPDHCVRFRAMDWGFAAPFCVGWYATANEPIELSNGLMLPRGGIVKYREWYGAQPNGEGLRQDAEEIAEGIKKRTGKIEKIDYGVCDPSAFNEVGSGPSIAERMANHGVIWRRADNNRLSGWDQVRARLRGDEDDNPMLVFTSNCLATIRTLPALQHDQTKIEDLDTDAEDHAADETRYACMSRPWTRAPRISPSPHRYRKLTKPATGSAWTA